MSNNISVLKNALTIIHHSDSHIHDSSQHIQQDHFTNIIIYVHHGFITLTIFISLQAGLKAYELRTKSKEQLAEQLVDLKKELAALRVQQVSKQFVPKIKDVRKNIARVLTIINAQQRASVRAFYEGKKYIPKELRAKKTRALRRALTKEQKNLKTERARKAAIAYPVRNFALKA